MKLYILLLIILFAACRSSSPVISTFLDSPDKQTEIPTIEPEMPLIEVELTCEIETIGNNKIRIFGKTNLPDGTNLNVRVSGKLIKYDYLSEIKARDGEFQSAVFALGKYEMSAGEYIVSVIMPLTNRQPVSIQKIIGKNGEKLTGKLIRRFENSGATILVRKEFQLTPDGNIIVFDTSKK